MLRTVFAAWAIVALTTVSALAVAPTVAELTQAQFKRVEGPETGGAALFPNPTTSWYDLGLGMPTVDFDGALYRMWFVGHKMTNEPGIPYGMEERIGLATSSDGIRWTIANEGKPVLDFGPAGKFDDAGVAHPFVLRGDAGFTMWYGGIDGRTAGDIGAAPANVRIERIGMATSTDGIHWTRANGGEPVLDIGTAGSVDNIQATGCDVMRQGDGFVMWYGAYNGTHTIARATSSDGIHWTKADDGQSVKGLTGSGQLGPSVYFDGQKYLMLYEYVVKTESGGGLWKTFAATSLDGTNWKPAYGDQPLLGPAPPGNFGSADGVAGNNHSVHPSQMIFLDDRVRVWYAAEGDTPLPGELYPQSGIGLMEAVLQPTPEPNALVLAVSGLLGLAVMRVVWWIRKNRT